MAGELTANLPLRLLTRSEQQLVSWLGVLLLVLLVLICTVPAKPDPRVQQLEGRWSTGDQQIAVPILLSEGARLHHAVQTQSAELHGLYLGAPRGRVRVLWDGRPLTATPVAQSAVVPVVPGPPGEHLLALEISGDYSPVGISGPVLFGPASAVSGEAAKAETRGLTMVLALGLLSLVHLTVGAKRVHRPDALSLGVTSALFALFCLLSCNLAFEVLSAAWVPRLRAAVAAMLPAMVLVFTSTFAIDRPRWKELGWIPAGMTLAVVSLFGPGWALYTVETLATAAILIALPWLVVILVGALRRQSRNPVLLLLLAIIPLVLGALSEILLFHGFRAGTSWLPVAMTLFVGGASAALSMQHAIEGDRHRRLVRGSADAMLTVDRQGSITDANPAAIEWLGLAQNDLAHTKLVDWFVGDDHDRLFTHIQCRADANDVAELRMRTAHGHQQIVESVATLIDNGQSLLVLRDVTQRKRLDHSLMQAARMETVGLLLGGIAHDFNNMLGTLLAHVGFLQVVVDEASPAQKRLGLIESTVERASLLTRRLLTVAGSTGSNLEATDLGHVCRRAIELVAPTLPQEIRLSSDLPEQLPPVLGAATDLEHVIVNLLVNAKDALGETGEILVRARAFRTESGGRGVVVAVEDNGPGLPEKMREQVFEPFVSTKAKGPGSGLGLAVSAKILKDHYGRIWAENRPNGGARFLIALRHADSVDEAPAPLPSNRQVLLVEDETVILEEYAHALRAAGYLVQACSNGGDAWSWLQTHKPAILVTDVVMPGISGIELATLCNERHPDIPVLLVSGFIPTDAINGFENTLWQRLNKPVRTPRLVSSVGRLCRRSERAARGQLDITEVSYLFPPLEELSAKAVGLD